MIAVVAAIRKSPYERAREAVAKAFLMSGNLRQIHKELRRRATPSNKKKNPGSGRVKQKRDATWASRSIVCSAVCSPRYACSI